MNQHEWVQTCTRKYKEQGLTPGDPEDGNWERAHYPTPECEGGKECIWLLHNDHQVQGVLQSEEYQSMCFFSPPRSTILADRGVCVGMVLRLQPVPEVVSSKWKPSGKNLRNSRTSVVILVSNVCITFAFLCVFVLEILCGTKI
jgi:hypothetical protein